MVRPTKKKRPPILMEILSKMVRLLATTLVVASMLLVVSLFFNLSTSARAAAVAASVADGMPDSAGSVNSVPGTVPSPEADITVEAASSLARETTQHVMGEIRRLDVNNVAGAASDAACDG
jgi:hypothetical protein